MILDIGVRATQDSALSWASSHHLQFPVLYDENAVVTPLFLTDWGGGTYILPHTCIVDNQQIMQYTQMGYWQGITIYEIEDLVVSLFAPELAADVDTLAFGEVEPGSSVSLDVNLDNVGTGIVNVTSASVSGEPYSVVFTPGEIYAVEDEMVITVTFAPTIPGDYPDELLIESDAGDLIIPVTGTGAGSHTGNGKSDNPQQFALYGNYPNPFNAETAIYFSLDGAAEVNLEVFDIRGAEVARISAGGMSAGIHSLNFDGSRLGTGLYFYRLQAGSNLAMGKMLLLK